MSSRDPLRARATGPACAPMVRADELCSGLQPALLTGDKPLRVRKDLAQFHPAALQRRL